MRRDERRGVVDMVMSSPGSSPGSSSSSAFVGLEVKPRDGWAHAALTLFDHRSQEGTKGRGEDLLGQG